MSEAIRRNRYEEWRWQFMFSIRNKCRSAWVAQTKAFTNAKYQIFVWKFIADDVKEKVLFTYLNKFFQKKKIVHFHFALLLYALTATYRRHTQELFCIFFLCFVLCPEYEMCICAYELWANGLTHFLTDESILQAAIYVCSWAVAQFNFCTWQFIMGKSICREKWKPSMVAYSNQPKKKNEMKLKW